MNNYINIDSSCIAIHLLSLSLIAIGMIKFFAESAHGSTTETWTIKIESRLLTHPYSATAVGPYCPQSIC
jgi:hypothetical protein